MLEIASVICLRVCPGACLTFLLRGGGLGFAVRLALAVTVSPLMVAALFYALRVSGLTFERTVPVLTAISLVGVLPMLRIAWREPPRFIWRRLLIGGVLYAAVAACVAIPWLWEPAFRRFSWHGLMHVDICYAFARGALVPEEPLLAGVSLGYPWFGHIYWSVLAWAGKCSPTDMYVVTNLVLMAAIGVLASALARELGASEPMSLAAPVLLALGPSLVGLVGWSLVPPNENGAIWAVFGDLRIAPFLLKFVTFEIMTFGIALYVGVALLVARLMRRVERQELLLAPLLVVAVAALYPHMFPLAGLLFASVIAVHHFAPRYAAVGVTRREVAIMVALAVLAAVAGFAVVKLYTAGTGVHASSLFGLRALARKAVAAMLSVVPFGIAFVWLWRSEPIERRGPLVVLGIGGMGALALNLALRLAGLHEYKFFVCAGICVLVPACVGIERVLLRRSAHRWAVVAGAVPVLAVVMLMYARLRIPHYATMTPELRDGSYWLALSPASADAAWTDAVRARTPPDTVVVVNRPPFRTTSFTARSLLVPSEDSALHCGYNMPSRFDMLELRGYSPAVFEERFALLERIYGSDTSGDMAAVLARLRALGRPIALVFKPADGRGFLRWLGMHRIGSTLIDDRAGHVVHLIGTPGGSSVQVAGLAPHGFN